MNTLNYCRYMLPIVFLLIFSCSTNSKIKYQNYHIIEIESEEQLLYTKAELNSPVANTIKKGSILFITSTENEFIEVYTRNPKYISKESLNNFKFYLYKPKYSRFSSNYTEINAKIVELPYDSNKNYKSGERGGCYYMNSNGNKTYVNRSYCSQYNTHKKSKPSTLKNNVKTKSYSSACGAKTKSGGYCKRKVKGGGRCYQH